MPSDATPTAQEHAALAALRHVSDAGPGISRRKRGKSFSYHLPDGTPVRDKATIERIRALAIPPAYTDVWICPDAEGHIQATGRDERGRKQYRYHARWHEVRDAAKYEHMLEFAQSLPAIRARVAADMRLAGLPREKVLATIVHLLESTLIRVGNDDYAEKNESYGLTTLQDEHVQVQGAELRFRFKGKSGKDWELGVKDKRVARIVRACQDLPGQELFQYLDEGGEVRDVASGDVNAYLREISGRDITAKDFRTWAGTVLAAVTLKEVEHAGTKTAAKRALSSAIRQVASQLGNTPAVCRKAYVHPHVLDCYLQGELLLEVAEIAEETGLRAEEHAVLALLQARMAANSNVPPAKRRRAASRSAAAA